MKDRVKLIAFDLDGTLAESKQRLPAEMGELLVKLLHKYMVAIMSGASFAQFETQVLPSIPDSPNLGRMYLFSTNAAQCHSYKNGIWVSLYDKSFNVFEKSRIMQALKEALAETGLSTIPEKKPEWGEQVEDRGGQITYSALGQRAPIEEKQKWDPTRQKRKPLYEALLRRLPDFSVALNATTSIDITPKGINKAYGIRQLIEMTEISVGEMLYIGDALEEGGNDSVVKQTGVHTIDVFGPEETAGVINRLLNEKN
jgi:phosphomannomutase